MVALSFHFVKNTKIDIVEGPSISVPTDTGKHGRRPIYSNPLRSPTSEFYYSSSESESESSSGEDGGDDDGGGGDGPAKVSFTISGREVGSIASDQDPT